MREIAISKFKATCLAVLDEVDKTHESIRITRRGKPIAQIVPSTASSKIVDAMGCMIGRIQILGDIVSPSTNESEWEALR